MFTGIIEALGKVLQVTKSEDNLNLRMHCPFIHELQVDQSVAHNGVCLTVTEIDDKGYSVIAIRETLNITNLGRLEAGNRVNLERCMHLTDRLDGHMVQGHVDALGVLREITPESGSWRLTFDYPAEFAPLLVHKGSVCINGVSLTVIEPLRDSFQVAIIPYTWNHTQFHTLKCGDFVNLEFDILGKYVQRRMELQGNSIIID